MTDTSFQKLLDELAAANSKYKSLLDKAEEEYKKRFGNYPSDVDDDGWIDVYHVGCGRLTVKQVTESALNRE